MTVAARATVAVASIRPGRRIEHERSARPAKSDSRSIAMVVTAMTPWPHIVLQPSLCMNSTPACAPRRHRLGEQRAVHVGVAARLEHQRAAQMIDVLLRPRPLVEHRRAFGARQPFDDETERLAGRVGVDGADSVDHVR